MYLIGERSAAISPNLPGRAELISDDWKSRFGITERGLVNVFYSNLQRQVATGKEPKGAEALFNEARAADWRFGKGEDALFSFEEKLIRRLRLSELCYAIRSPDSRVFDLSALDKLREAQLSLVVKGLSSKPFDWLEGNHWEAFDGRLKERWTAGITSVEVKLRANALPFGKSTVAGTLSFKANRSLIDGWHREGFYLEFKAHREPKDKELLAVLGRFKIILENQRLRSDLAEEFRKLPKPEPMDRELFLAFVEALSRFDSTLPHSLEEGDLKELLVYPQPSTINVGIGQRYSAGEEAHRALEFKLDHCLHCGAPQRIRSLVRHSYDGTGIKAKYFDGLSTSKIFGELHRC